MSRSVDDKLGPYRILALIGAGGFPVERIVEIGGALAAAVAESTPPFSPLVTGCKLLEEFRGDPEIDRMLFDLYGR